MGLQQEPTRGLSVAGAPRMSGVPTNPVAMVYPAARTRSANRSPSACLSVGSVTRSNPIANA